jgi:hypothetical protein
LYRYSILIGPSDPRATLRETVEAALSRLFSPLCTDVQFGRTMVFLRTQKARAFHSLICFMKFFLQISSLDLLISEKREFSSTCIQSFLRFFLRKESKKVILLLIKLYIVRLILFPNIYKKNLVRACVQLQTFFRGLLARGNYKAVTGTLAVCQTCIIFLYWFFFYSYYNLEPVVRTALLIKKRNFYVLHVIHLQSFSRKVILLQEKKYKNAVRTVIFGNAYWLLVFRTFFIGNFLKKKD